LQRAKKNPDILSEAGFLMPCFRKNRWLRGLAIHDSCDWSSGQFLDWRAYKSVQIASCRLDNGEWSPGGDYLPERDRHCMFKPEIHTVKRSVT
jgi:hypothetical protein